MSYAKLLTTLTQGLPSLQELCLCIPYMTLDQRKTTLTVARTQSRPLPGTLTRRRLSRDIETFVHSPVRGKLVRLRDILEPCTVLDGPLHSGLISMLLRNAPIDEEELRGAIESGIAKEIAAASEPQSLQMFNYSVFLSLSPYAGQPIALAPGYPIDTALHKDIYNRFVIARRSLSKMTLYPDYSKKTIGRNGARNLSELLGLYGLRQEVEPTTLGLEQVYHRFGIRVAGETEARWALKYNDLKPRVYYARGPDQYYDARYIQQIFNVLVDAFPCTNRFERFMLHSVRLDPEDTLFIYDYSSFTSRLLEVVRFIDALADFMTGTPVQVIDTYQGPLTRDLGDIIREWRQACHITVFDASGLRRDPSVEEEILLHGAGMLGVPGNISSCTLLHGLHLSIILGTLLCKVVGDDALGGGQIPVIEEMHSMLSALGEISLPKMECWRPQDPERDVLEDTRWHYTKRPIDRVDSRILQGEMIIWPPIAILLGWKDRYHTVNWPRTEYRRYKTIASFLLSFALQFETRELLEEDEDLINRFLRLVRQKTGIDEYVAKTNGVELVYPRVVRAARVMDDLIEDHWNCVLRIPELVPHIQARQEPVVAKWYVGGSSRMLKLSRDLGYCTLVPRFRDVLVRNAESEVRAFFSNDRSQTPTYDIYIHDNIPSWMVDVMCTDYALLPMQAHVGEPDTDSDHA